MQLWVPFGTRCLDVQSHEFAFHGDDVICWSLKSGITQMFLTMWWKKKKKKTVIKYKMRQSWNSSCDPQTCQIALLLAAGSSEQSHLRSWTSSAAKLQAQTRVCIYQSFFSRPSTSFKVSTLTGSNSVVLTQHANMAKNVASFMCLYHKCMAPLWWGWSSLEV